MDQIGPYRIVEEIARGGMGVVYKAQDPQGQVVALKLLLRNQDERARKRFQVEVGSLRRLKHSNVVPILDAGEHDGHPWLALEFIDGESLDDRLHRGPLRIDEAIRFTGQLAQALSYVHSCGVLHRDLKPANVLLRGDQALLTDFGLALDTDSSVSRITATGVFQGTPGYWAPEQARGQTDQFGPLTDVYGLGAVLYACLIGTPPVEAGSLHEYLQTLQFRKILSPRRVNADVPDWLSKLCMDCLALVPVARPASAEHVARALVTAGVSESVGSGGSGSRVGLWALLVLGIVGVVSVGWWALGAEVQGEADPTHAITESERDPPDPIVSPDRKLQVQAFMESGATKFKAGRYAEAIEDFDKALGLDPRDALAYRYRGSSKLNLRRFAEAIQDFDKALELDPRNAIAYANRGGSKARLGRDAEAIDDFDKAIEFEPRDSVAYADRGLSKGNLGRYAEAIEDFDKALGLGLPKSTADQVKQWRAEAAAKLNTEGDQRQRAQAFREAGDAKFNAGHYTEAIEDYDTAIQLNPRDFITYAKRGIGKANLGRYAEAIEDYDTAIQLNPRDAITYGNRGASKGRLDRYAEAIEDCDKALELDPRNALANANRGWSKAKLGRYAKAIEDFDRALGLGLPQSQADQVKQWRAESAAKLNTEGDQRQRAQAFMEAGDAKFKAGRYAKAIEDYDKAIQLDPRNARAYHNRGGGKAELGRYAEAIEDYDKAIQLDPQSAFAYAKRGTSKGKLGRYAEAIEDFDNAIQLDPRDVLSYAHRGWSKANLGRYAEATEDYDKALELDPRYAFAYRSRGQSKVNLGRYADSIEDYDKALELDPRNAFAYANRGVSKASLGRYAEAIEDYDTALELDLPQSLADRVKQWRTEAAARLEGN